MKNKMIIIAGPTASGKSEAGVRLAGRMNGSIISADSMQVYRGMDIGSAKITKEEMQGIPHELIDVADPHEEWNVVRFQKEAKEAEERIRKSGRLPILVGGTGFYIQALLYDIDFTETRKDFGFRTMLEEKAGREGPESLYRLLQERDPESAAAIHPNNIKRVIRALEFSRETGEKISDHNKEQKSRPAAYDAVYFVLTMDRDRLYRRIDLRVDRMMEEGLLDEVKRLRKEGFTSHDVSMQGLGYKQLLQYLDGEGTLEDAVSQIKLQTRHFAKRQLTWFRREKNVVWVNRDEFDSADDMLDAMEKTVREKWKEP